jgi:hypothetical protein
LTAIAQAYLEHSAKMVVAEKDTQFTVFETLIQGEEPMKNTVTLQ